MPSELHTLLFDMLNTEPNMRPSAICALQVSGACISLFWLDRDGDAIFALCSNELHAFRVFDTTHTHWRT